MQIFILFAICASAVGHTVESVTSTCFMVNAACHEWHTKAVAEHIKQRTDRIYMTSYVSHSTTSTKYGMHSMIVYK